VKAVLDHFDLNDVTLMGFSLGGGLVIRAAAAEPRVRRVIANDILTDFFEVSLRQLHPVVRLILAALLRGHGGQAVNTLVARAMKQSLVVQWRVQQGMHVTGSQTPYAFLQKLRRYRTGAISSRATQDILLLAGADDHYVPRHQFYDQIRTLSNVRSLTARLFTRADQAQNHCQVGNIGLALEIITTWLDRQLAHQPKATVLEYR